MDILSIFKAEAFTYGDYTLNYRIYVPADYNARKAYPLVLFFHGSGERGDDNCAQLAIGLVEMFKYPDSPIHQAIVIAPQCPKESKWANVQWPECIYSVDAHEETDELKAAYALVLETQKTYSIDDDRIYVTGLSMGGYGTWDMLTRHGDTFAAAAPLCGGCDVSKASLLADIPIWTFHGGMDDVVPPTATRAMAEAMTKIKGAKLRYTELETYTHGIWGTVYSNRELADWMFSQKRSDR